jgi:hypothetical protein
MANSPSQQWEDGRMVSRAIETNRHRVLPDGTEVGEKDEIEATTAKPYKVPTATKSAANRKAMESDQAENKAVARSSRKRAS